MKVIDLFELYREARSSTVTHNRNHYSVNKMLKAVEDIQPQQIPVDDLKWILEYDDHDDDRVEHADLQYPIIVSKRGDVWYVMDGAHRLKKAVQNKQKEISAKIISQGKLADCKI